AAFADLLPAPLELRAGHGLDPLLAAVASELAARLAPTAGFDPPGDISRQRARDRRLTLIRQVARQRAHPAQPGVLLAERRYHPGQEHLELAGGAKLAGQPLQLPLDRGRPGVDGKVRKKR